MEGFIFNLTQLLRNQFPNERFYPNEQYRLLAEKQVPDRRCLIQETTGTPEFIINIPGVEIRCRDIDPYNAREFIWKIYNSLLNNCLWKTICLFFSLIAI